MVKCKRTYGISLGHLGEQGNPKGAKPSGGNNHTCKGMKLQKKKREIQRGEEGVRRGFIGEAGSSPFGAKSNKKKRGEHTLQCKVSKCPKSLGEQVSNIAAGQKGFGEKRGKGYGVRVRV